jgi:anti-sigma regulatory factor (Ser/Thr protein kinase)
MTEFDRDIAAAEEKLAAAAALFAADPTVSRPARAIQQIVFDNHVVTDDAVVLTITFSTIQPLEDETEVAPEQRWRFHSSDALSAQAARLEIGAYLRQFAEDENDVFQCELIAGELLANTVEHAPGLVEVCIDWSGATAKMTVRDAGPGMTSAHFAPPEDPWDENGRGLFLVKKLAPDVCIKGSPGFGSEVRVTLPIRRYRPGRNLRLLDSVP